MVIQGCKRILYLLFSHFEENLPDFHYRKIIIIHQIRSSLLTRKSFNATKIINNINKHLKSEVNLG